MGIISQKTVITRKEHRCFGCGRRIPVGSRMTRITYSTDRVLSTEYWCRVCSEYWRVFMGYDDEISCGDLARDDDWEVIREEIEGNDEKAGER